ncbi:4Fe-4S dicluster domain-containing protein [Chloroflexota bacterium]
MADEGKVPAVQLILDYDKCCGCRICESVCSIKHFGEYNPELSRIRVYDFYNGLIQVPSTCWGCRWKGADEEAFCIEACPVPGALSWYQGDKMLNVPVVNEELCIKCLICVDACQAKAIRVNPRTGFPMLCDRCDGDPECVKACPTNAVEGLVATTNMERFYGSDSPEEVAEKMKNHMFYPWKGLEDWRD